VAFRRVSRLTRRERQVLHLLVDGSGTEAIADKLVISPQTARTHIQNILAFPAKDEAGKLVAGDGATSLELVLFDIADVPQRLLRWEVK